QAAWRGRKSGLRHDNGTNPIHTMAAVVHPRCAGAIAMHWENALNRCRYAEELCTAPVSRRDTPENAECHTMIRKSTLRPVTWLAMLGILGLAPTVQAATATVILSQDCDYILMDSPQGQILAKVVKGEHPKPGDTLEGSLQQRSFT